MKVTSQEPEEHGSIIGSVVGGETTSGSIENSEEEVSDEIATKETRAVLWLRVGVVSALLSAGFVVTSIVYILTSNSQEETFEAAFLGETEKVFAEFSSIVSQKLGALASLGVAFTAYSKATGSEFPFVAMNDFHQRTATARILSGALSIESAFRVELEEKEQWEEFTRGNSGWFWDGFKYQEQIGYQVQTIPNYSLFDTPDINHDFGVASRIFDLNITDMSRTPKKGNGPFFPMWQTSPVRATNFYNFDRYKNTALDQGIDDLMETGSVIMIGLGSHAPGMYTDPEASFSTKYRSSLLSIHSGRDVYYDGQPLSQLYVPVFDDFSKERKPVGLLIAILDWPAYLQNVVSESSNGVVVVISNDCYGSFTYLLRKKKAIFLGNEDHSNPEFAKYEKTAVFGDGLNIQDGTPHGIPLNQRNCVYNLAVYPSDELYDEFHTHLPVLVTCCILGIFLFTMFIFFLFNRIVERRQYLVLSSAQQTGAIVSSMFPKSIRERLLQAEAKKASKDAPRANPFNRSFLAPNHRLKSYLNEGEDHEIIDDNPIADLFPFCTDISGFTSWSSTREPAQVFILLQSIYQAFDIIARQRGVFKIETIGDTYVAVCGLPSPQKHHAEIMSQFAWDCLKKFQRLTKHMELTLGPDTSALGLRIGIHSGPVTAGVLRGDRARFQLFGDAVNTAARMESTSRTNRIQLSNATAQLLIKAGKKAWVNAREDVVMARGLGALSTFWLVPHKNKSIPGGSLLSGASSTNNSIADSEEKNQTRLISWMSEILGVHIRKVLAHRQGKRGKDIHYRGPEKGDSLSETVDVIQLPKFDSNSKYENDYQKLELEHEVTSQLRDFVSKIASMYRENPFHNFEHACHVCMCIDKFVKRIVAPDLDLEQIKKSNNKELASHLHDYTYGINTDPLLPLALIFSGLIHDADHRGCSNAQLGKENPEMAKLYNDKSIAEQNSLDLSWNLLMGPQYQQLRNIMFGSQEELQRFRQLVVNVVLATDIFDKELNGARKARWNKAFDADSPENTNRDLRATIVIEHIIQASDVSHTMQHWHVYRKYNKRLFKELHQAFKDGRMGADPCTFWYKGELGFFDNYVIPLAEKLKACNVFGVSSDECLNYALQNRAEWEARGLEIVNEMIEEANSPVAADDEVLEDEDEGSIKEASVSEEGFGDQVTL